MKFIWASGETREFPMGTQIHGMRLQGKRPECVQLDFKDFQELFKQTTPVSEGTALRYLNRLSYALAYYPEEK